MSIRIYALAKQLKVESKSLVEVCRKIGLEGKNSALASLNDEEAAQIKAALHSDPQGQKETTREPDGRPLERPTLVVPSGKIPVLKSASSPTKAPKSKSGDSSADTPLAEEPSKAPARQESVVAESTVSGDSSAAQEEVDAKNVPKRAAGQKPEVSKKDSGAASTADSVQVRDKTPGEAAKESPAGSPKRPGLFGSIGKGAGTSSTAPSDSSAAPISPIPPAFDAPIRPNLSRGPLRNIDGRVPTLDSKKKKAADSGSPGTAKTAADSSAKTPDSGSKQSPSKSGGPSIRLAPLPKPSQKPAKTSNEPAPQKPDLKLPKEAIRAAQMGASRPLTEHIRKHEEKRLLAAEGKKGPKGVGTKKKGPVPAPPDSGSEEDLKKKGIRRIRGRDGKMIEVVDDPRAIKRKTRAGAVRKFREDGEEETGFFSRPLRRQRRGQQAHSTAAPRKNDIVVQLPCTVKQYAELTGLSVPNVIRKLMEFGTPKMINSPLDKDTAELLAVEFGLKVEVRAEISLEDRLVTSLFEVPDPPESLKPRPPIVTFLGHVDHGKTSLLDRILNLNVVSGEKGGITQHIRAYRVPTRFGDVTFVDTPGHEAFTEMRARGANATDIVVLVVAADDGVMPQTEEAISHAKAAGVPIVVALNKMDLHGVNPDKAIQGLATNELIPSEWGGDIEVVRCSALTGMGIDELMQTLLTVAELHELKANPDRPAIGVALEAELQAGQGVVCKALVRNGTLRTGDIVLCGNAYGRVKAMHDTLDTRKTIDEAPPSTPVELVGLNVAPEAGSQFCVLEDISEARQIAETRDEELRKRDLADVRSHVTLENLYQRINQANEVQILNIIIRADVRGSIEAIRKELGKLDHAEVKVKILQAMVGGITEADVQLADASDAIIVGFNVVPDENARNMAEKKKVQIRRYDIIYNLSNDIKSALEGMLKPMEQVRELGRALVQRVFSISRLGSIAGCRILSGYVERDSKMRIIRDSRIIGEYFIDSLKREKDDAKEVREGYECGIKLKSFNDLKEGDILEAYRIEEVARTF